MTTKFKFLSKTIFFPKQGILAVGDLHLGYDSMLKSQGIMLNFDQLEETKKELENIIKRIKATSTLKKIVLLGDIKHHFAFQKSEIFDLRNFLRFLEQFLPKEDTILIKGNHDTFTLKGYDLHDFHITEDLAFTHGHKSFKELESKEVKTIVMGHVHPAILIKDKIEIKKEKFKCFLIGNYKKKQFILVPSFFPLIQGSEINELENSWKTPAIIPKEKLKDFETYVISPGKSGRVYSFGKYSKI